LGDIPYYAAAVIIELWKKDESEKFHGSLTSLSSSVSSPPSLSSSSSSSSHSFSINNSSSNNYFFRFYYQGNETKRDLDYDSVFESVVPDGCDEKVDCQREVSLSVCVVYVCTFIHMFLYI
jgi:hypothetical protein